MARYVVLNPKTVTTFECEHCGRLTHIPTEQVPAHQRPMHDCPALGGMSVPISSRF